MHLPAELLLVVAAALVLGAVAIFVVSRRKALPSQPERPALEPAQEKSLPAPDIGQEPKLASPEVEPAEAVPEPTAPERAPAEVIPLPVDKPVDPALAARRAAEDAQRADQRERYNRGLARTRGGFVSKLARLFRSKPRISDDLIEELEMVLFTADIGTKTAQALLEQVTRELRKQQIADIDAVWGVIRAAVLEILNIEISPLDLTPAHPPYVLLMIGVNGVGKTTTLGKMAARYAALGHKVLLVAGDTYRAAAGEQLEIWARRVGCGIYLGKEGSDPSSVIFDGIVHGHNEGYGVVLCDTAGRLHTKKELMSELEKIRRTCAKARQKVSPGVAPEAITGPHDTFLALDATIGQNALSQAILFKETMDFTGIVMTKLDGTAKGGVLLGVVDELKVPVRFIGIGEGIDDLRDFEAEPFCDALLLRE